MKRNIIKEDIRRIESNTPWTRSEIINSIIERSKFNIWNNIISANWIDKLWSMSEDLLWLVNLQTLVAYFYSHYKTLSGEYWIKVIWLDEFWKKIIKQRNRRNEQIKTFQSKWWTIIIVSEKYELKKTILDELLIYPENPNPGLIMLVDKDWECHDILDIIEWDYI